MFSSTLIIISAIMFTRLVQLETKQKIVIASAISAILVKSRSLMSKSNITLANRKGIKWELDLNEGIDLYIYLFGQFEPVKYNFYKNNVHRGATIIDIGANIGAHTIPLGKLVGVDGKIHAIEPTNYAFQKLKRNINLNPSLSLQIHAHQLMFTESGEMQPDAMIYSSWPLDSKNDKKLDADHKGLQMSTNGASSMTLDQFVSDNDINEIQLIKLDVDGNESRILKGSINTLSAMKPIIIMEIAPFVYKDSIHELAEILTLLSNLNYTIKCLRTSKQLSLQIDDLLTQIAFNAATNVVATPMH